MRIRLGSDRETCSEWGNQYQRRESSHVFDNVAVLIIQQCLSNVDTGRRRKILVLIVFFRFRKYIFQDIPVNSVVFFIVIFIFSSSFMYFLLHLFQNTLSIFPTQCLSVLFSMRLLQQRENLSNLPTNIFNFLLYYIFSGVSTASCFMRVGLLSNRKAGNIVGRNEIRIC